MPSIVRAAGRAAVTDKQSGNDELASVGVMVLLLMQMIFHQIQLMECAVLARRYREQEAIPLVSGQEGSATRVKEREAMCLMPVS